MEVFVLYFVLSNCIIFNSAQKVKYLNAIEENEPCEINETIDGRCLKISECFSDFVDYRNNKSVLNICKFDEDHNSTLICCNKSHELKAQELKLKSESNRDFFSFETCQKPLLKYRENAFNPLRYYDAYQEGIIPKTIENCDFGAKLFNDISEIKKLGYRGYGAGCCKTCNNSISLIAPSYHGNPVELGDRPNMVAVGWTLQNNMIEYRCGGSLLTEKFILTAAHCKFYDRKQADTVRLGDRNLITEEDDEYAQQLEIEEFILHPKYTSFLKYNDIALIKTVGTVKFNRFVVPACISDIHEESNVSYFYKVTGYGQTEKGVISNILLETTAYRENSSDCNHVFEDDPSLPDGIIESQFCVKSPAVDGRYKYSDTCFGDSGGPLHLDFRHEEFPTDFNKTFLSRFYATTSVYGLVSFGASCGLGFPSVYTRIYYFKDWIESVITNNSEKNPLYW